MRGGGFPIWLFTTESLLGKKFNNSPSFVKKPDAKLTQQNPSSGTIKDFTPSEIWRMDTQNVPYLKPEKHFQAVIYMWWFGTLNLNKSQVSEQISLSPCWGMNICPSKSGFTIFGVKITTIPFKQKPAWAPDSTPVKPNHDPIPKPILKMCPPSGWPGRRSKCCSIPPWCWRWCVRSGRSANVWREWCFFFLQEILGGFLVWEIWGVGFLLAWGFQGKTPEKSDVARVGASISRSKRNKWWKKWSLVLLDPVLPKKKKVPRKGYPMS